MYEDIFYLIFISKGHHEGLNCNQRIEYSPSKQEALGSIPKTTCS